MNKKLICLSPSHGTTPNHLSEGGREAGSNGRAQNQVGVRVGGEDRPLDRRLCGSLGASHFRAAHRGLMIHVGRIKSGNESRRGS